MAYLTPDVPPTNEFVCRRIKIPASPGFLELVSGALSELTKPYNWEESGTMSVEDTVQVMEALFLDYAASSQSCVSVSPGGAMLGTIAPYVTALPPSNCLPCDGSQYNRVDFPDLYAALDAAFILDADTFVTPDLRGRTVIGAGQGTDLTLRSVGDSGGEESHQLTIDEMPQHRHSSSTSTTLGGSYFLRGTGGGTTYGNYAGGDQSHNNMPPFIALKYCVVAVVSP